MTPADLPALSPLPPYIVNRNNFIDKEDERNIVIIPQQFDKHMIMPPNTPADFQNVILLFRSSSCVISYAIVSVCQ